MGIFDRGSFAEIPPAQQADSGDEVSPQRCADLPWWKRLVAAYNPAAMAWMLDPDRPDRERKT